MSKANPELTITEIEDMPIDLIGYKGDICNAETQKTPKNFVKLDRDTFALDINGFPKLDTSQSRAGLVEAAQPLEAENKRIIIFYVHGRGNFPSVCRYIILNPKGDLSDKKNQIKEIGSELRAGVTGSVRNNRFLSAYVTSDVMAVVE